MAKSKEARNKALALKAFDTLFNKRDYAAAERLWSPNYIQHSAHIEPGREAKTANETLILEPSRRQLLQKRSENMRSEKAIMTSRREFLSNALGIAFVAASLASPGQRRDNLKPVRQTLGEQLKKYP